MTRIDWTGAALRASSLAPLPAPLRDATACAVPVHDSAHPGAMRVVLVGGRSGGMANADAVALDPSGDDTTVTTMLARPRDRAALAVLGTGLLLLAGGRSAGGTALDDVLVLSVQVQPDVLLAPVSPAPRALFDARFGAAVVAFSPGRILLAGGQSVDGAPLASAEIVDAKVAFPPEIDATGALPVPLDAPLAVTLPDDTVLVAGAGGLAVYVPPRGATP